MQPIVDGLEAEYEGQIEFRRINASTEPGVAIYNFYGLRGHPGYVLLNPAGEILWQGLGEQPLGNIKTPLEEAVGN